MSEFRSYSDDMLVRILRERYFSTYSFPDVASESLARILEYLKVVDEKISAQTNPAE